MMLNNLCRKLARQPASYCQFPYIQAQKFFKQSSKKTIWPAQQIMKTESASKNSVVSMPLHQFRSAYQMSLNASQMTSRAVETRNFSTAFAIPMTEEREKHTPEKDLTQPIIVPQYWTGSWPHTVNPESFTIDCGGVAPELDEAFKARMQKAYAENQLVVLKNTGISDLPELRKYVDVCLDDNMLYEGGANARKSLDPYFYETGAPKEADLHYHHEMAYVGKSCTQIAFTCKHTMGGRRGATYLSDAVGVTDELMKTELGQKLKEKGLCYWRNLTDRAGYAGEDESTVYNHW